MNSRRRSSSPRIGTGSVTLNKVAVFTLLYLIGTAVAAAQDVRGVNDEAEACIALARLNLEAAPGEPAVISSSRLVDVPATGLDAGSRIPGGFGGNAGLRTSKVKRYCNVTGYVAPQNKFELRLPLRPDWNQNFFFSLRRLLWRREWHRL
jgi:hypothetical protein